MFILLSREERDEIRGYAKATLLALFAGSVVLWLFS